MFTSMGNNALKNIPTVIFHLILLYKKQKFLFFIQMIHKKWYEGLDF